MDPRQQFGALLTRRHFFGRSASGIGGAALLSLLGQDARAEGNRTAFGGLPDLPHFAPKAKRVIYLFQSGAPSQITRNGLRNPSGRPWAIVAETRKPRSPLTDW